MAYPFQLGFRDATAPLTEELLHFHDHTLIIVSLISSLVLYIISLILAKLTCTSTRHTRSRNSLKYSTHYYSDFNFFTSLQILYIIEEIKNPSLTVTNDIEAVNTRTAKSQAVPSLGLWTDATPGLSSTLTLTRPGSRYGQWFRNLRVKSQLHTSHPQVTSTKIFRKMICIYIIKSLRS
ncbi:hypothetical protein HPG69_017279 [Diceros bicornis minor]|uniref:Cytochrome c oxidase subunit 2 n=1 Tax=Diceros bicornis minor TaxID=77932 RepID=A0A7J7ED49_DICBM|nr:hypothetical protein HPG69_017279 [Diceros bicornis minor]